MNLITDEGKYYLYRHIRLDKNEVFYVGIGTKVKGHKDSKKYRRAYTKENRNKYWISITNKCEYKVDILLESDDISFIRQKEIEFISLYGRKNLNKGTLCNLTDGGEGNFGLIVSEETRKRMSMSLKGRVFTKEWIRKFSEANRERIVSKETRLLLSKKLKGKKRTEEQREKMREAQRKIDRSKVNYSNYKRGENAVRAKLTNQQVLEIADLLRQNKLTQKEIGELFGVSKNTITTIYTGNSWGYLTGFTKKKSLDRRRDNTRTKLSTDDIFKIKDILLEGYLQINDIALMFGVAKTTIVSIAKGKIWKDITGFNEDTFKDRRKNIRNLAKLSIKEVKEIKKHLHEKTISRKDIAEMYGVSISTIKLIKANKIWKHIN